LNSRVTYVTEIKRLLIDNSSIYDRLASESVEFILEHCAIGIRRELETFETIVEGLKKVFFIFYFLFFYFFILSYYILTNKQ